MNHSLFISTWMLLLFTIVASSKTAIAQNTSTGSGAPVKAIHVFVALCDNKYQGIVKVPAGIGNGQQPSTNLYWGAAFGVKTFFKRSKEWKLISTQKVNDTILERLVFQHIHEPVYLVADAYDGRFIETCTRELIRACYGMDKKTIKAGSASIGIGGNADLLAYCGHDGLMDFDFNERFNKTDQTQRALIVLACYSRSYFSPHMKSANILPLVWSNGLMSPEAYTLHAAIQAWIADKTALEIREQAATAYASYQHCSLKAAKNLLVTGW